MVCNMHKMSSGFQYLLLLPLKLQFESRSWSFLASSEWLKWLASKVTLRVLNFYNFNALSMGLVFPFEHHNMKTVRKVSLANKKRGVKVAIIY